MNFIKKIICKIKGHTFSVKDLDNYVQIENIDGFVSTGVICNRCKKIMNARYES